MYGDSQVTEQCPDAQVFTTSLPLYVQDMWCHVHMYLQPWWGLHPNFLTTDQQDRHVIMTTVFISYGLAMVFTHQILGFTSHGPARAFTPWNSGGPAMVFTPGTSISELAGYDRPV